MRCTVSIGIWTIKRSMQFFGSGLRVQVFLNTSDYLPTTEAAGLRLATHPQGEQPFPDTAGYSAPTGFISSFGIYLVRKMYFLPYSMLMYMYMKWFRKGWIDFQPHMETALVMGKPAAIFTEILLTLLRLMVTPLLYIRVHSIHCT